MEKYSFFNAVMDSEGNYDREYLAEDFAAYFASFIGNGVYASPSSNLKVTAAGGFNVAVSAGKAWVNGYFYENTSAKTFKIDVENTNGKSRIDSIVLRLDLTDRKLTTELKKGTMATNPVAPTLTRSTNIYELCLGDIKVVGGASSIVQGNITDCRFTSNCGVVSGVVEQIDTDGLFSQYDDEFRTWFEEVQNTLSTDAAGNLYKQIETERKRIDTLVAQKGNEVTTETELEFVGNTYCDCGYIKVISNGISAELHIKSIKWTSTSYGFWQTIAELPESLYPLTQSKSGIMERQVLYKTDNFAIGLRDNRVEAYSYGGAHTYHTCMVSYPLKNPVVPELQDIRVDVNGEVHASAGEAIRRQFETLSNNASKEYKLTPITQDSEELSKDTVMICIEGKEIIGASFSEKVSIQNPWNKYALFQKTLKKGDSLLFSNAVNINNSPWCDYIYLVGKGNLIVDAIDASECLNAKEYTLTQDGTVFFCFEYEGISGVGEYFYIKEASRTEPIVLDANTNYENNVEAGEATLKAIMEGRNVVVKVPNVSGDNYVATYSPIYMYQLPNYKNNFLYLFYLKDEKQEFDLSALGIGKIEFPIYGQIKMKLSREYNQTPLM